jgi:SPP1 family predicted phage head-tail adaptor
VKAADLRHKVSLISIVRGRDAIGGALDSETGAVELWAKVDPVDTNERFADQALQQRPSHRVTIRWRAGVKHRDLLRFRDREYQVLSVRDPDERRTWLELLVAAKDPGA